MAIRRLLIAAPGLLSLLASVAACTTVPAATGVPARTITHAPHTAGPASPAARASPPANRVPAETRRHLAQALEFLHTKRDLRPPKKHGLIPL